MDCNMISKFRQGHLDAGELRRLRDSIDAMTDEELDRFLDECGPGGDEFTSADIDNLGLRLNNAIRLDRRRHLRHRVLAYCAAIAMPLLCVCAYMLFSARGQVDRYRELMTRDIRVETARGEYLTVALPDGSRVEMAPESTLSYNMMQFNSAGRRIAYSGEGRFAVSRDPGAPFALSTGDFKIEVLGTEFALLSRPADSLGEVYLESGSIRLSSASGGGMVMQPGDLAVIDRVSGRIERSSMSPDRLLMVNRTTLYYSSTPLADIIRDIERYYGTDVAVTDDCDTDQLRFTGSIPVNDLDNAIYTLEQTLSVTIASPGSSL